MREIKFRAWDKGENKWIDSLEFAIDPRNGKFLSASEYEFVWSNHSNYELMQYTGLKDKNGKEIYEGDIVEWSIYPDDTTLELRIKDSVGFGSGCFNVSKRKELLFSISTPHRKLEVIGNIYENPELL